MTQNENNFRKPRVTENNKVGVLTLYHQSMICFSIYTLIFSLQSNAWEPEEATLTDPVAEQLEYVNETVPEVYGESYSDRVSTTGSGSSTDSPSTNSDADHNGMGEDPLTSPEIGGDSSNDIRHVADIEDINVQSGRTLEDYVTFADLYLLEDIAMGHSFYEKYPPGAVSLEKLGIPTLDVMAEFGLRTSSLVMGKSTHLTEVTRNGGGTSVIGNLTFGTNIIVDQSYPPDKDHLRATIALAGLVGIMDGWKSRTMGPESQKIATGLLTSPVQVSDAASTKSYVTEIIRSPGGSALDVVSRVGHTFPDRASTVEGTISSIVSPGATQSIRNQVNIWRDVAPDLTNRQAAELLAEIGSAMSDEMTFIRAHIEAGTTMHPGDINCGSCQNPIQTEQDLENIIDAYMSQLD